MSEDHFSSVPDPLQEGERPIPPVDEAWALMRRKLDTRLPVTTRRWYAQSGAWAGVGAVAVVAIVAVVLTVRRTAITHNRESKRQGVVRRDPAMMKSVRGDSNGLPREGAKEPGSRAAAGPEDAEAPGPRGQERAGLAQGEAGRGREEAGINREKGVDRMKVPAGKEVDRVAGAADSGMVKAGRSRQGGGRLQQEVGRSRQGAGRVREEGGRSWQEVGRSPQGVRRSGEGNERSNRPGILAASQRTRVEVGEPAPIVTPGSQHLLRVADSLLRRVAAKKAAAKDSGASLAKNRRGADASAKVNGGRHGTQLLMAAGIDAGMSFPVAGAGSFGYNSNGQKGVLSDYLPGVYFRYYPGEKYYIQARLGFHSPQYTHSQLIDSSGGDSSHTPPWQSYLQYNTITLKKLYYNDLGLSFHFRAAGGFWLGAGVQLSLLSGGVGLSQQTMRPTFPGGTDTTLKAEVFGLKDSTGAYNKLGKMDWRGTIQLDYTWRRLTASLRFQQAFHSYMPVLPGGARNPYRNGSFGIFVTYDIWERKNRK